jgi:hypothetical protein
VIFLDIDLKFFVLSMDALGIILHFFYLWSRGSTRPLATATAVESCNRTES